MKSTAVHSGEFTCVAISSPIADDGGLTPVPVHIECWNSKGVANDYQRVKGAARFVVGREWAGPSLPAGTQCCLCGEVI